jgi:glycosyltransferase involved in cell wall biosynthesis
MAEDLTQLHCKPVSIIPNGFDAEDYKERATLLDSFIITYTGSIYKNKRDPSALFEAIYELKNERKIDPAKFKVRFFGGNVDIVRGVADKYDLQDNVDFKGFIPFKECVIKQKESAVLLLLSWDDPREKGVYTGKVFEYLGASRPILAIGRKGSVVDSLLAETGAGIVCSEIEEAKRTLLKWYTEYSENRCIISNYCPKIEIIQKYTRKAQTEYLAKVFDDAAGLASQI